MKLNEYKRDIAAIYDRRRDTYDKGKSGDWHYTMACKLVECANLQQGQKVLDLATGTGMVALEAAKKVGSSGHVIGVDIAANLLTVAQQKIATAQLTNVTLLLADIEILDFVENILDCVFCCSALPLLTNVPQDLLLWRSFLVPGGKIGLCVFSETAFVYGVILQKVARRYGINITMSDLTGTPDKCYSLLSRAGYKEIEIITEQYGDYLTLDSTSKSWDMSLQHPHCYPLLDLSTSELAKAKAEYMQELEALVTDRGIWNDVTTYFVIAKK